MNGEGGYAALKAHIEHSGGDLAVGLLGGTAKRSGKARIAKCPFHDDTKPSLSIYNDGRTRW